MTDSPRTPGGPREEPPSDLDGRIADSLRRRFAPDADVIERTLAEPVVAIDSVVRQRWVAAAAAAVLVALSAWWLAGRFERSVSEPIQVTTAGGPLLDLWADAYEKAELEGFRAPSCCAPGSDIAALCRAAFDLAVELTEACPVDVCGCYSGGETGGAVAFLAMVEERPMAVFVLRTEDAPAIEVASYRGLAVHRREVGKLTVFELSRQPAPRVLPHLVPAS